MAPPSDTARDDASERRPPPPAERLRRIQSGEARDATAGAVRTLLTLASAGYVAGRWLHRQLYRSGLRRRIRLPRPVLSVGNLTAGGAGKTPMVAWLCRSLQGMGRVPVVLARGYGRRPGEAWNEEGLWLRGAVPGLDVLQDPDRAAAALAHLRRSPADLFVLDDGFQHERLARDLDLVLVDGLRPFGYGHRLPRGLLRDPPAALARADVVLLTRAESLGEEARAQLAAELRRRAPDALHGTVGLPVTQVQRGPDRRPASDLRGRRVFLLCGVGHPESVRRTVEGLGAEVVGSWFVADHHDYRVSDRDAALEACRRERAELVVTAKDQVKLARLPGGSDAAWVLQQEVRFWEGEQALWDRLRALRPDGSS